MGCAWAEAKARLEPLKRDTGYIQIPKGTYKAIAVQWHEVSGTSGDPGSWSNNDVGNLCETYATCHS